jgi:hypothetical protein
MVTMRMNDVAAAVLMVSVAALPLRAQEGAVTGDPVKGAALMADARQALGGADKLAAVKTLQVKGSFRRQAGNNQIEGDLELLVQAPDKMKRTEDTSLPGGGPSIVATQTLNGTEVWDENTGGGRGGFGGGFGGGGFGGGRGGFGGGGGGFGRGGAAGGRPADNGAAPAGGRNIDPEQIRQAQLRQRQGDLSRLMLIWLLSTDAPVTWIGEAQSPDGMADVLEVRPADGGAATRLFLDTTSHMPLMITWQGNAGQFGARRGGGRGARGAADGAAGAPPDGPPPAAAPGDQAQAPRRGGPPPQVTLQMALSDYKTVGGIKLPHTIARVVAGQTTEEWTISSYKLNQTFKANTFEQKK